MYQLKIRLNGVRLNEGELYLKILQVPIVKLDTVKSDFRQVNFFFEKWHPFEVFVHV